MYNYINFWYRAHNMQCILYNGIKVGIYNKEDLISLGFLSYRFIFLKKRKSCENVIYLLGHAYAKNLLI